MKSKSLSAPNSAQSIIDLGVNPVNSFQAREYAKESSPSVFAVILELTENARDNATEITLTIDVEDSRIEEQHHLLRVGKIICEDNGTGLSHREFLNNFCGAYSASAAHHDTDRAGRNGVGTKTYTSIADKIIVQTTTGRPSTGFTDDTYRESIEKALPENLELPIEGAPDTLWRVYEFRLHTRAALPAQWSQSDPLEMGTRVELLDLHEGIEIDYELLVERLSYAREWLQHGAHSFTVKLTGKVPTSIGKSRLLKLKPWSLPDKPWLTHATGRSDDEVRIIDESKDGPVIIPPAVEFRDAIEFDFRVIAKNSEGLSESLKKPALLLEICGALPYAPNLGAQQSARTMPLLTFVGLNNAGSIGAFCNSISGWARINSLQLKSALRNNKTTLAAGPGTAEVEALRDYLHKIIDALHKAWFNATRGAEDHATRSVIKQATDEVNMALKGVNRNPFKEGEIARVKERVGPSVQRLPTKRHRWECGSCGKRWLAIATFTPETCAETQTKGQIEDGCGSQNIGLAKNQPRIGDCLIRQQNLGDPRIAAQFQFEKSDVEDEDVPVVSVNIAGPRYVELRGSGSMSGQGQRRLKQYLVDISLVAIATYYAEAKGSDFAEELGTLYFNRMLRSTGIKAYEAQVRKIEESLNQDAEGESPSLAA